MRLLHATELRFQEFLESETPAYAILSHRWGANEVSYQDMLEVLHPNTKLHTVLGTTPPSIQDWRFAKIQSCRIKALEKHLHWIWVDTCCINKESSAELTESINSMYRWYQGARVCFVYMSDVLHKETKSGAVVKVTNEPHTRRFRDSDWFTRGWTLQELLAPKELVFYDALWRYIGTKTKLAQQIAERTCIDFNIIQRYGGLAPSAWSSVPVAKRMSWASSRITSRPEDIAYCLLGLFDVNMPLLYGEGRKAFTRLQLEIIKKSDDESIFAWRRPTRPSFDSTLESLAAMAHEGLGSSSSSTDGLASDAITRDIADVLEAQMAATPGMLAHGPAEFAMSQNVWPFPFEQRVVRRLPYSMTNHGLMFYVEMDQSKMQLFAHAGTLLEIPLNCFEASVEKSAGRGGGSRRPIKILLRKESGGDDQHWVRHDCERFSGERFQLTQVEETKTPDALAQTAFYIRSESTDVPLDDNTRLGTLCLGAGMYGSLGETYLYNQTLDEIRILVCTMCTSGKKVILEAAMAAVQLLQLYAEGNLAESIIGTVHHAAAEIFAREAATLVLLEWMVASAAQSKPGYIKSWRLRILCHRIENTYGTNHPETITAKYCLGSQLLHEESYREAVRLFRALYSVSLEVYGTPSMVTANILGSLSCAQSRLGHFQAAIDTVNRSLQAAPGTQNHPHTLELLSHKALICAESGNIEGAETYYRLLVRGQVATLGPDHTATLSAYDSLRELLVQNGTWEGLKEEIRNLLTGPRLEVTQEESLWIRMVPGGASQELKTEKLLEDQAEFTHHAKLKTD
jgi:hypothetical protein